MRALYLYFFASCFYLSQTACDAQPRTIIRGTIATSPDWRPEIYLIQPLHLSEIAADYLGKVIDSTAINDHGIFCFSPVPVNDKKNLVLIAIQNKESKFPNHLTDQPPSEANYMPLFVTPGEHIDIIAEANAFQKTFRIEKPSKENKALMTLKDIRLIAFQKFLLPPGSEQENDTLLLEKEKAFLNYINPLIEFSDSTTCPEAAMVALKWISPTGDFENIPEFVVRQCKKWRDVEPENIFIQELCKAAGRNKLPLLIGDPISDYPLPLISGDTQRISSLLGKKITVLDIWASWCAPCRKENRTVLVPLWSAFKDKGLQIIGYSLDSNPAAWKAAVSKDNAVWIQASHLTGDSTPFLDVLRISTIPANFIIDGEGKILAKNLHGEELSLFIKEYLN